MIDHGQLTQKGSPQQCAVWLSACMKMNTTKLAIYGVFQSGNLDLCQMNIHRGGTMHPRNEAFVDNRQVKSRRDITINTAFLRAGVN